MPQETNHLSDQEILLAIDGELSSYQRGQVRAHLADCGTCSARLQRIQAVSAEFVRFLESDTDQPLPSADAVRTLLKSRLAEASAVHRPSLSTSIRSFVTAGSRWAAVATALIIAAFGFWAFRRWPLLPKAAPQASTVAWLEPIPDRKLTPGATLPITAAEVCRAADSEETHPIPVSMQQKVFQEYRTPESQAGEYEVDFLITPGLGGADDIRNLWLEPYSSTVWNAHVKDALEDRLHDMVCAGKLDLATAQHDIATDWISAYKKYFHTQSPLSSHS